MRVTVSIVALGLVGCSPSPSGANTASTASRTSGTSVDAAEPATSPVTQATNLSGRWIGVEGMYLNVSPLSAGRYTLEMQYDLDNRGSFAGTAQGDGIAFERGGVREVLRPSDGAATGLKHLAGKIDCLTVKPGEGYCRR